MEEILTVTGSKAAGYVDDLVPEAVAALASGALGSRELVEAEIDVMLAELRRFWQLEPDEVMHYAAAFSARCTELAVQLDRPRRLSWTSIRSTDDGRAGGILLPDRDAT